MIQVDASKHFHCLRLFHLRLVGTPTDETRAGRVPTRRTPKQTPSSSTNSFGDRLQTGSHRLVYWLLDLRGMPNLKPALVFLPRLTVTILLNPPLGVEVQPTNAKESVNITRPSMREKYIR